MLVDVAISDYIVAQARLASGAGQVAIADDLYKAAVRLLNIAETKTNCPKSKASMATRAECILSEATGKSNIDESITED